MSSTSIEDVMTDVVQKFPADKWRDLGIQLGLSSATIDSIQSQAAGRAVELVLGEWHQNDSNVQTIVDALMAVGELALANELEVKYGKRSQENPAHGVEMLEKLQKRELEDVDVKPFNDKFVQQYCSEVKILLQAANNNESLANFSKLQPPYLNDGTKSAKIVRFIKLFPGQNCTGDYFLGIFGGCKVALVQTNQGSKSQFLIQATIRDLFPKVSIIIGVGVAYGSSRDKTKLGDVLISRQIACMDNVKFKNDGVIESQGPIEQVKETLNTVFCNSYERFNIATKFACTEGASPRLAKAHVGYIISGNFLVNNRDIKSRLGENVRQAIGGEMEGHVLMDIMRNLNPCPFEAIIIKGVCDYGDGTKEDQWQLTAALAAAEYTHFQLEQYKGTLFVAPTPQQVAPTLQQVAPTPQQVAPTPQQVTPTPQQVAPTLAPDVPTIRLLTNFPYLAHGMKKNLNIIQRTSTCYDKLGMYLLDDDNCDIINPLKERCHHDPVKIVTDIYTMWISGTGRKPVTWQTLVAMLREEMQMSPLADDIECAMSHPA